MTIEYVEEQLKEISRASRDHELAHSLEDELHSEVLSEVAHNDSSHTFEAWYLV